MLLKTKIFLCERYNIHIIHLKTIKETISKLLKLPALPTKNTSIIIFVLKIDKGLKSRYIFTVNKCFGNSRLVYHS